MQINLSVRYAIDVERYHTWYACNHGIRAKLPDATHIQPTCQPFYSQVFECLVVKGDLLNGFESERRTSAFPVRFMEGLF